MKRETSLEFGENLNKMGMGVEASDVYSQIFD